MADFYANLSWASLPGSGDGELARIDFGSPQAIAGLELKDVALTGADLDDALTGDTSNDGTSWTPLADTISLSATARTRRIMAPPGAPVTARYVRLRQADPAESGGRDLSIGSLAVATEGVGGAARIVDMAFDDASAYAIVISARNMEVYLDGVRQASIKSLYTNGTLGRVDFARRLDTMLLFHESYSPWRVFRLGSDKDWEGKALSFESMRRIAFPDTSYTNGVNERQQIEFEDFTNGDTFNITLDGETTSSISYSSAAGTMASNIEAALEALSALGSGTVAVAGTGTDRYQITFENDAGQQDWPQMAPSVVSSATGVVTSVTLQEGEEGGEDAISTSRGWPRCGAFADSRLLLGGLRDLPQTIIASKLGEYFSFEETNGRATDAIEFTIDTEDANGIRRIFNGEVVQVFTASGVHFLSGATLLADEPVSRRKSGSIGIQLNLSPVALDNSTVYVQKGGRGVRELQFDGGSERFVPTSLSVRAPSLIDRPFDIFLRKTGVDFEDEMLGLINQDGRAAVFTSLKDQAVAAWARETTPGSIVAAQADAEGRVYYVIERTINGQAARYVEVADPARTLDCSILATLEDESVVPGLSHLEARDDVYAVGLGRYWGPLTVSGGLADLGEAVTGELEVGIFFDAHAQTLEPRFEFGGRALLDTRKRIVDAAVSVIESAPPGARYRFGKQTAEFPFKDPRPEARQLDRGPLEAPLFTGVSRIEGFRGWDRSVDLTIYRRAPGPLHIRSLKLGVQV